jgi:hypothetical protein
MWKLERHDISSALSKTLAGCKINSMVIRPRVGRHLLDARWCPWLGHARVKPAALLKGDTGPTRGRAIVDESGYVSLLGKLLFPHMGYEEG